MGIADRPVSEPIQRATSAPLLLLTTFVAAIVLSASLLFMVQPMFTKMVLPRFGGAPSVWSVAIVFFQSALVRTCCLVLAAAATSAPVLDAEGHGVYRPRP